MANPQKEDGHLEIANELVEILMKSDFSGGEFALIFAVLRKTWGWQKKEDWIPLSQLAKLTGFSRRYVCKIKKQLVNKRTLLEANNRLRFNKNYEQWLVSNRSLVNKRTLGLVSNRSLTSELKGTESSVLQDTLNIQLSKDTNSKESVDPIKNSIDAVRERLEQQGVIPKKIKT